jgi:hypothetical protein
MFLVLFSIQTSYSLDGGVIIYKHSDGVDDDDNNNNNLI